MIRTLLKKQLLEMYRGFFFDQKKGRKRSAVSTVLLIIFYFLLTVGVLGGLFTLLAISLCGILYSSGLLWLYYATFGLIASAFGIFGSVFSTYAGMYLAKDNDLLLSMPVPVYAILVARLLGVYLMGAFFCALIYLPGLVVAFVLVPQSALSVAGAVLLFVLITIFVLSISSGLGWVVAKISTKLKQKNIVTVLISLVFFALYYMVCFRANELLSSFLQNAQQIGGMIRGKVYPLYLFGRAGEGDVLAMFTVTVAAAALFLLAFSLISHSFIRIAVGTGYVQKKQVKVSFGRRKSVSSALVRKEFARFTGSATYMLNCGLGIVLSVVGGIFLLTQREALQAVPFFSGTGLALIAAAGVQACLISMNDMAAPSVSLEGKMVWILQSLPVSGKQVLMAKFFLEWILTIVPTLFFFGCAVYGFSLSPAEGLLLLLFSVCMTLLSSLFDLFLGIRFPNLAWTNEIHPIKQSLSVTLAIFGSLGYAALIVGGYFLLGFPDGLLYLLIVSVFTAVLALLLYFWIAKKGAGIFRAL